MPSDVLIDLGVFKRQIFDNRPSLPTQYCRAIKHCYVVQLFCVFLSTHSVARFLMRVTRSDHYVLALFSYSFLIFLSEFCKQRNM
jgi:hypothetical protein